MKIKMKNEEMAQSVDMLRELSEKGKLGYAIMRNMRKLSEASTEYRKLKDDAIRKYGNVKKMDNGQEMYFVPKEKFSEYLEEVKGIAAIEEEVDIFTVSEEEFYSGNLTSQQMNALFWMIEGGDKDGDSGI